MTTAKSQKPPLLFYTLVSLAALSLFGLWFFMHPKSPWHSRNHYIVEFDEIGNLKVNNAVYINGISKGHVVGFQLTDSCVSTKIAVLSEVKIPKDSKPRIKNAGLMGERVIEISLGNSTAYYENGARIAGNFDMGGTSIGNIMVDILKEANDIAMLLAESADSLFSDEKIENYNRIGQKAKRFGNSVSRVLGSTERSIESSLDSLIIAKNKAAEILNNISSHLDSAVENLDYLQKNIAVLGKLLEDIKNSITSISKKLQSGENTVSLTLDKYQNGKLRNEMQKFAEDTETLMKNIKKRGLDLNVDIF